MIDSLLNLREKVEQYPGKESDEHWQRLRADLDAYLEVHTAKLAEPASFETIFTKETEGNPDTLLVRYRQLLQQNPSFDPGAHFYQIETKLLEQGPRLPPDHHLVLLLRDQHAWLREETLQKTDFVAKARR